MRSVSKCASCGKKGMQCRQQHDHCCSRVCLVSQALFKLVQHTQGLDGAGADEIAGASAAESSSHHMHHPMSMTVLMQTNFIHGFGRSEVSSGLG